ncbi:MAG: hypothetical protein CL467_04695 [Acidimicrobiaceae bacterium]|nr:hypothetical protein [Acidimicrobiaceae bacterium]|tara:strand:+ start:2122 stop:3165 length:1044 start_codon:yes stop_codon:yes gene_type:complete
MTFHPLAKQSPVGSALDNQVSKLTVDSRIPMVVLGGWLGAGKTTLLNRLLRAVDDSERIAVLVNDVGEVNLDVELVASRDGDTVELTNGCVCCTIGDSLAVTLRDLALGDRPPDRILVEASGIAEPDRVAAYGDRRHIRPDGIVVAVDATDVVNRAADRIYGSLVRRQVVAADLLLVTKADLTRDDGMAARSWCGDVAVGTPVVTSDRTGSDMWVGQVLGSPQPAAFPAPGTGLDSTPTVDSPAMNLPVETLSVLVDDRLDADNLAEALSLLRDRVGSGLLRAKAVLSEADGSHKAVHLAGGRVSVEPAPRSAPGILVLIAAPGSLDGVNLSEALRVTQDPEEVSVS